MSALIVVAIVATVLMLVSLVMRFALDDNSFTGGLVVAVLGGIAAVSVLGIVVLAVVVGIIQAAAS